MKDKGIIIAGLIVFLILITFPIWFTNASGKAGYRPEPELPKGKTKCVESADYMRDNHMALLMDWRDKVVRDGQRVYVATDNTEYDMSLSKTCLGCHTNKAQFCDRCHDYVGLTPYCWDCHMDPKGG